MTYGNFEDTDGNQIREIQEEINQFHDHNNSIFCLIFGAINHWMTLIAYKKNGLT